MKITYKTSGVNIKEEEFVIKEMSNLLRKTFRFRKGKIGGVLCDIGLYANLIDMGDYALAVTMDGVGSKVLVAQELRKYDTIGIDLVAMNVNDLICVGAEPLALLDYLAMEKINPEIAKEICVGLYEGARLAGISIIGGETATLPDIIKGIDEWGFDLAGTAVGIVKKDKIITGDKISPGDSILGFKSNGIHSNGLTLARKVLPKDMWLDLLLPTRIYVKEIMTLISEYDVHGLAHITGGGFKNLERLSDYGFMLNNLPKPHPIFTKIQTEAEISDEDMYRTFNMGIGFCAIVDKKDAEDIVSKYDCCVIGEVTGGKGVKIIKS